ncbi:MAG: flavodoxin family protein [Desulfonatronovibrionaceae bacterium]
MKPGKLLILACSPRKGGNSDTAASLVQEFAGRAGMKTELIYLRKHQIIPCQGCNKCAESPDFSCVLDSVDSCRMILDSIDNSDMICICSPIYFYHLPAGFKGLIDRGQSFYFRSQHKVRPHRDKTALCVLAAGRKKGEHLFEGSLLTLKYFLDPFGYRVAEFCARGMDQGQGFAGNNQLCRSLENFLAGYLS